MISNYFALSTHAGAGKAYSATGTHPVPGIPVAQYIYLTYEINLVFGGPMNRKLTKYEQTISAALISAKEEVLSPMRPRLRENSITEPQWRVMRVLNDRGRTDATALAEVAILHAPSVTRILKELEARGIVIRENDPDDGRRALAALTPEGRDLLRLIARDVRRVMNEYAERFGSDRLERLLTELQALTAAIKGAR